MRVCSHLGVPRARRAEEAKPVKGTTTLELPRKAGSAGIARLIVTAHCAALSNDRLKSANLMISELVTNAFKHGHGRIELTVSSSSAGVRAEVTDEGAEGPIGIAHARPDRG